MELDEMKQMWQQYDKVLQQNKMLNEQLINHIINDKSKNIIKRLIGMEYFGISVCGVVLLPMLVNYSTLQGNTLITVCYFITVLLIGASLAVGFYKIKRLSDINIAANAVADTAEKIQRFRLVIVIERAISVIAAPVLLIAMVAVMVYWWYDVDIFEDIMRYMPRLILGLAAAIIAMLVTYRNFYFHSIRQLTENLKEIEQFKKE